MTGLGEPHVRSKVSWSKLSVPFGAAPPPGSRRLRGGSAAWRSSTTAAAAQAWTMRSASLPMIRCDSAGQLPSSESTRACS